MATNESRFFHSRDTSLSREAKSCITPKTGFNTAQGDVSDTPQLCPSCPVGSLNAEARHLLMRGSGESLRAGSLEELALRLRLLHTHLERGFTTFSPTDHRLLYRFGICGAHREARGDCFGSGVPGFEREPLDHWNRFAGRWHSRRVSTSRGPVAHAGLHAVSTDIP